MFHNTVGFESVHKKIEPVKDLLDSLKSFLEQQAEINDSGIKIHELDPSNSHELYIDLPKNIDGISKFLICMPISNITNWRNSFDPSKPMVYQMKFLNNQKFQVFSNYFYDGFNGYVKNFKSPEEIYTTIITFLKNKKRKISDEEVITPYFKRNKYGPVKIKYHLPESGTRIIDYGPCISTSIISNM
jgi:hypothetical protein